jgi:hypothetical protein
LDFHYGKEADNLYISTAPLSLMDEESMITASQYLQEIGNVQLVIIDTLHRNSGAADENSSTDFAKILNHIDSYIRPYAKVVLWVHHTGHNDKGRRRGTSSRYAACDAVYQVERKEGNNACDLICKKMKDAEEPKPLSFLMQKVSLEIYPDEDDPEEELSSLVPVLTDYTETVELKEREQMALDVLLECTQNNEDGVPEDRCREKVYEKLGELKPDSKRKAFIRIKEKLLEVNFILQNEAGRWNRTGGSSIHNFCYGNI